MRRIQLAIPLIIALASQVSAEVIPSGFVEIRSAPGVKLYQKNEYFVQVVHLDQGGQLRLANGNDPDPNDCFSPIYKQDLNTFWGQMAGNADAFSVVNAQFFSTNDQPTGLAFTVKTNGGMVHCGYEVNTGCQDQKMIEIWDDHVKVTDFDHDWRTVENSEADNVIVGLGETCPKSPFSDVGRTFFGSEDPDGDGRDQVVYILSSPGCTIAEAASTLRSFGAQHVVMFDGGGSSQLICQGQNYVSSSRQIPQVIEVFGAGSYRCSYAGQTPVGTLPGGFIPVRPNQDLPVSVSDINVGTRTWLNSGGVGNQDYVEMWACEADGDFANSPTYHSSWTNPIRVDTMDQASVPPGGTATFSFTIHIPSVSTQELKAYFRPTHGGQRMFDWGGMHFPLLIDADVPQIPPNLTVNPSDCTSTNSFYFDWDPSGDVGSGLKLYTWKINTGGTSNTTNTFVQVNNHPNVHPGWNTFYVLAEDNAGNQSVYASVQFCLESSCNLSFEDDGNGDSIPDGWEVDSHGGSVFSRRSGGPDGSYYVRVVNADGDDWMIFARSNCNQITAGQLYRISFWYNTNSTAPFEWALFRSSVSSGQKSLNSLVSNPIADGQWHQFWSAPFSVSSGDLSTYPKFGVKVPPGSIGTFNFDGVFFVETELCQ